MKQFIGAVATALGFWKQKAEGLRLKAVGQLSQKQLTNRLPQPASHNPDASGFAMTGGGGAVLVNGSVSVNSSICKSNDRMLTENSALAVAVGMQKFLHFHCSNWRSGGSLLLSSYRESNSLRGNEREDYGLQNIFGSRRILFIERENGSCALGLPSLIGGTRPSPFCLDTKGTKKSRLSNLWLKQLRIGAQTEPFRYAALLQFASSPFRKCFLTPNLLRPSLRGGSAGFAESRRFRTCGEFSQKQSTQGLSQTALLNADASGFTMTGEGGAVLVNGSVSVNSSISKSNDRLLTENSALAVAVEKEKFLHLLCSNWRSGGSLLLSSYRESNSLRGNEREDYGLQNIFGSRRILFIERENGSCALGLPSLIGGTRPSPFCLDTKGTKKSRLSNLWLKQLRIGAQTEPFRYAALLQFASSPFRKCFLTPNLLRPSLRGGSAGFAESRRFRTCGEFSQKQSTQGLSQPALLNADALGFTRTGEGGAVLANRSVSVNSSISKSNNRLLTENSALAVAVKKQKFLQFHCSNWRSGGSLLLSSYRESNSLRGNEREDYGLQYYFKFKDNRKSSQKQSTQGLSQPAFLNADALGFTMTGEGDAVLVNGSISVNNYTELKNNAFTKFLKKLWKGYLEKQNHRKEVQRRLLRQRAIKRERDIETGKWTDRFLKSSKFSVESSKFSVESEDFKVESKRLKGVGQLSQRQITEGLLPLRQLVDDIGLGRMMRLSTFWVIITVVVIIGGSKGVKAQIKALQIGDSIKGLPAYQTLKTRNTEGFLLLFINSTCKGYQNILKEVDSLGRQSEMPIIAVTEEKKANMAKGMWERYQGKYGVQWLNEDEFWQTAFPHRIQPHVVWVNHLGVVTAITSIYAIELTSLLAQKKGEALQLPVKRDILDFEKKESLVIDRYPSGSLSYSLIKPHIAGVEAAFGVQKDSVNKSIRTYLLNLSLFKMYMMAFGKAFIWTPNRLIWDLEDRSAFLKEESSLSEEAWQKQYTYCYESILPMHINNEDRLRKIRDDLNLHFGLHCREENRTVDVWVLQATGHINEAQFQKRINTLSGEQAVKELRNSTLSALLSYYNSQEQHRPVIDETHFTGKIDLRLAVDDMNDIPAVNAALAPYHLRLVAAQRSLDFIVFSKKP